MPNAQLPTISFICVVAKRILRPLSWHLLEDV